jgi:hypothetical protein
MGDICGPGMQPLVSIWVQPVMLPDEYPDDDDGHA